MFKAVPINLLLLTILTKISVFLFLIFISFIYVYIITNIYFSINSFIKFFYF
nr:MAG TPA: hypothetical protein [Caudoviricetes sp.]